MAVGELFRGTPPPTPTLRPLHRLRALAEQLKESNETPTFENLHVQVGPDAAADRIQAAGKIDADNRFAIIREVYESTLARVIFGSLEHFEELVDRELREEPCVEPPAARR